MSKETVHIIKMAPGLRELKQLELWFDQRFSGPFAFVSTKSCPTRKEEILNGGSLYWVFGTQILARQEIVDFDKSGINGRCVFRVKRDLIPVSPTPKRPFQGWRYLRPEEAPMDVTQGREREDIPDDINAALARLGLI